MKIVKSMKIKFSYFNKKEVLKVKKYNIIFLWGIIAAFFFVYLSLCFNHNIWTDEGYTIDLLRNCKTIKDVWLFTAQDVHPPLYYMILLPFSNIFGINLLLLKIISIVPMIIIMIIGATYIKKEFGFRTALLFILFVGVIPCTMEYAVQVRMYSWAMLFVTVCGLSAYNAFKTNKNSSFVLMACAGTACAYTHYFSFISVIWIYGFLFLLFIFKKPKALWKWLFMALGSVIMFLPWLPYMYQQVSGVSGAYWIPEITKDVIESYFSWLFETDLPYSPLLLQGLCIISFFFISITIYKYKSEKEERNKKIFGILCLFVLVLTVVVGVVLSNAIRPIFIIRYVIPCIGLLSLFLAIGLGKLPNELYILLILFCVCLGIVDYENTYYDEYKATKVVETEAFFQQNLGEDDFILYNFEKYDFIYEYYFDKDKLVYIEDMDFGSEYENLWFINTGVYLQITPAQIEDYGLSIFYMGSFGIEHNEFKIYQIRKK